jgi:cyclopropane fatty-acyl-phospholipid synthase-like methyltransferase
MDFSNEARSVLFILNNLSQKGTPAAVNAIRTHPIWTQQGLSDQTLTHSLDQLLAGGWVARTGTSYLLTAQGAARIKQFMSEGFSALLAAAERSPASRKFCEQVYGLNLCQFNSMSMAQLDKLLEVMNLDKDDQILDLGCGVGLISEYISDGTGASVVGIDFAAEAISRAQERTHQKRERLSYQVMDMDDLNLPGKSFTGAISIDALHFVHDLKPTIQTVLESFKDNGQMGFFYAVNLSPGDTTESLEPEQTPFAKVLQEYGLNFRSWDFTQDEGEIWEKILHVSEALRHEYEAEGNLSLYESSVSDARPMLEAVRCGKRRRYLYHIR